MSTTTTNTTGTGGKVRKAPQVQRDIDHWTLKKQKLQGEMDTINEKLKGFRAELMEAKQHAAAGKGTTAGGRNGGRTG